MEKRLKAKLHDLEDLVTLMHSTNDLHFVTLWVKPHYSIDIYDIKATITCVINDIYIYVPILYISPTTQKELTALKKSRKEGQRIDDEELFKEIYFRKAINAITEAFNGTSKTPIILRGVLYEED